MNQLDVSCLIECTNLTLVKQMETRAASQNLELPNIFARVLRNTSEENGFPGTTISVGESRYNVQVQMSPITGNVVAIAATVLQSMMESKRPKMITQTKPVTRELKEITL
jgi:hypothetical protein